MSRLLYKVEDALGDVLYKIGFKGLGLRLGTEACRREIKRLRAENKKYAEKLKLTYERIMNE